jgi:hypothetical protein
VFELGIRDHALNGREMQQKISNLIKDWVTPELERRFDKLVSPDEVLQIRRLEIDLGEISENSMERQLPDILITKLVKVIEEELITATALRDQKISGNGVQPVAEIKSSDEAQLIRLARFLKTGYLDQSTSGNRSKGFGELLEELLESDIEATTEMIKSIVKHSDQKRRFIHQSSGKALLTVLIQMSRSESKKPDMIRDVTEFAVELIQWNRKKKLFGSIDIYTFRFEIWKVLFDIYLTGKSGSSAENMIHTVLLKLSEGPLSGSYTPAEIKSQFQQLDYSYRKSSSGKRNSRVWMKGLARFLREFKPETDSPDSTEDEKMNKDSNPNVIIQDEQSNGIVQNIQVEQPQSLEKSAENRTASDADTSAGKTIRNAGLVLLYPFIPLYFRRTGLAAGKQFVNEKSQQRAVHLLQFLATGKTETPEEELVLNKILCGIEPEKSILPGIDIYDEEIGESENLLMSLIEKWQALKNTSPETVKSTFLQRDGLIRREDNQNWKMTVERKTVDVLMDKLPWGISFFRMPWSESFIQVEW